MNPNGLELVELWQESQICSYGLVTLANRRWTEHYKLHRYTVFYKGLLHIKASIN
jgi:hypothetical protein